MNPANFPKRKERKRTEAAARQDAADALTPRQRLDRLDQAFGPGQGAKKERAKISRLLK